MKTKLVLGEPVNGKVSNSVDSSVWFLAHLSVYRSVDNSVYSSVRSSVWRSSFIL